MENDATILEYANLHGEEETIEEISFSELAQATSDFNESNIIGKGSFGAVYRGKLRGIERAIKVLHEQDDASQVKAYEHEVKILSRVKHPNIVRLIGTCPENFIVAYELMFGGNLRNCLPDLNWYDRLRIATEICSVLSYIHNLRPEMLVHGDLKPDNVLLDTNHTSKLCDFGISRIILVSNENSSIYHKTDVKGTYGYLDPAFIQTGHLAPSSDVYSFGMVLFRLLTKGRVGFGLITVVEDAIDEGRLESLLDGRAGWWPQLAEELSKIALRCCDPRPRDRPDLTYVHKQLEEVKQKHSVLRKIWKQKYIARFASPPVESSPQGADFQGKRVEQGEKKQKHHEELSSAIFSYTELEQAMSYFSTSNVLRTDELGRLYKGTLRDNEVAIKLLTNFTDILQQRAFFQEVEILRRLEHPNLVHLIGVCPEKFALVYEFVPETLEDRLDREDLLWKDRLRIAIDVCAAVVYLHSHESDVVVHGDVKPANILLDVNGVYKLDAFGKCHPRYKERTTMYLSTKVEWAQNYQDPAFIQSGRLATSADVYSFGMVLLRLLTKCRIGYVLIPIVEDALEEHNLECLLDDAANWPYQLAEQLSKLTLRCCNYRPKRRPDITEVFENLEQLKEEYVTSQSSSQVPFYS